MEKELISAGAGAIQENEILELVMASAALWKGVRKPASSNAPAPISTSGSVISVLRIGAQSAVPWAIAREPAARRKPSSNDHYFQN